MVLTANSGNESIDGVSGQQTVACYQIASLPGTYPTKGQSDIIVNKNIKNIYCMYTYKLHTKSVCSVHIQVSVCIHLRYIDRCPQLSAYHVDIKMFCMHTFPANVKL